MLTSQWILLALVPAAYILGSIPTGLLIGLAKGTDPRKVGSGNIGATNIGRIFGFRWFLVVFFLDLLKGLLATGAAALVLADASPTALDFTLWIALALAVVTGNLYSLFLGFRGGKGVATSAGAVLGVYPWLTAPLGVCLLVYAAVLLAFRIMSLASMSGAAALLPVLAGFMLWRGWPIHTHWPLLLLAAGIGAMVIWKHRANIARLRAGTEPRLGQKH